MVLPSALAARKTLDADLAVTLAAAEWEWRGMTGDVAGSWGTVGPRLTSVVSKGQLRAATHGTQAVAPILAEQGLPGEAVATFNPASLAGVASDGRSLGTLLALGAEKMRDSLDNGVLLGPASRLGWEFVEKAVATQVADAFRVAMGAQGVATKSATLFVRVVNPGACSRCVVLAGIRSGSLDAFKRHPSCRCVNIPTSENIPGFMGTDPVEYFKSLSEKEQDLTFTKAGAQAIRDGADLNQVVNARRGMSSTVDGAQKRLIRDSRGLYTTTEGMSRRGYAHHVMSRQPGWSVQVGDSVNRRKVTRARLMPESIYEIAGSRSEAISMLKAYGYF